MQPKRSSPPAAFLAALAALLSGAVPLPAQGFGIVKMTVKLQRKRPPDVYLMNTAINVRVESQDPEGSTIAPQLSTMLANELCRHDARLRIEEKRPEIVIHAVITGLKAGERWVERKSNEHRKTGEKRVWNEKKMRYDTRDEYGSVEVTKRYKLLEGTLTAGLSVTQAASGNALHSGTITESYKREFLDGNGAPVEGQLPLILVEGAVRRILPAVVFTTETVEVQLAKGKLEDSSKLAQSGLWTRMLETLETMPALKKPQDDAYRRYNLGVACEALAYQAEDPAVARKLLEQASVHYGTAIDLKPDEKYFREPQVRIQTAIAHSGKGDAQKTAYARSLDTKSKGVPQAGQGSQEAMTNQSVMDLVRSGLDEAILLDMIRESPAVNFDLGPQGVIKLLENKVTNKVIAAMRARAAAGRK